MAPINFSKGLRVLRLAFIITDSLPANPLKSLGAMSTQLRWETLITKSTVFHTGNVVILMCYNKFLLGYRVNRTPSVLTSQGYVSISVKEYKATKVGHIMKSQAWYTKQASTTVRIRGTAAWQAGLGLPRLATLILPASERLQ